MKRSLRRGRCSKRRCRLSVTLAPLFTPTSKLTPCLLQAALSGTACETCRVEYTLPPPTRLQPDNADNANNEGLGWINAMPAHVLGALRNPPITWAMLSAIVRRRSLRFVAPIILSPILSSYCKLRRMLKKRGVSRRRWACSLCRRRARWKCVRCLRSYYCSRECQNVDWHLQHKHLCFKPQRMCECVEEGGGEGSVMIHTGLLLLDWPLFSHMCVCPLAHTLYMSSQTCPSPSTSPSFCTRATPPFDSSPCSSCPSSSPSPRSSS